MTTSKTLLILRPHSPAAQIFQKYEWVTFGSKEKPCLAFLVRDFSPEPAGFLAFRPIDPDQPTSEMRRCHLSAADVLLIAPEPGPRQSPIGFVQEETRGE